VGCCCGGGDSEGDCGGRVVAVAVQEEGVREQRGSEGEGERGRRGREERGRREGDLEERARE
jgi:hypothetical protein